MTTKIYTLAALASLTMAAPAFADDLPAAKTQATYEATQNGGYDKKDVSTQTDATGTTTTHQAEKKVDVDNNGNVKTTVDIKDKTKPKGLFTKASTTEVQNTSKETDGKEETTHVKTVNGTMVEQSDDIKQAQ